MEKLLRSLFGKTVRAIESRIVKRLADSLKGQSYCRKVRRKVLRELIKMKAATC